MPNLRINIEKLGGKIHQLPGLGPHWVCAAKGRHPHVSFAGFKLKVLSFGQIPRGGPPSWVLTDGYDCIGEQNHFPNNILIYDEGEYPNLMALITLPEGIEDLFIPSASLLEECENRGDIFYHRQGRELLLLCGQNEVEIEADRRLLAIRFNDQTETFEFLWTDDLEEEGDDSE
ncbi:MAG: hypothetical protein H6619_05515 [Deltaproteobacteria bacterium]|nr:hypothetical protein [Deltaproteobacteria bacterium]